MGVDPNQFRACIVEPALGALELPGAEAAIRLVLGTAIQESGLQSLVQRSGPALGFFQIEPATLHDLYENFLASRCDLDGRLALIQAGWPRREKQLVTNPLYAAAVCRLIYYRAPDPLPDAGDLDGIAKYWKRFYNTAGGAGTVAEFVSNYRRALGGSST
jgi:hypothetical protein